MPASKNLSNVNVGTAPNSGDGDLLRDAFTKVNDNLNSLYTNGQFQTFGSDNRLLPGYTWQNDKDTGMFRKGSGEIGFTLNGAESLVLSELGTIQWYGSEIATQPWVTTRINNFTGGISAANITVTVNTGANVQTNVTVNGLPVVAALPTLGNHEGRIAFYNGDVWIFSGYPVGNGVGLSANPTIARAAGSDYRWVRFRSDTAISTGPVRVESAPEGTLFYETGNAIPYVYLSGAWRTLASVINQSAPQGLEVLGVLPSPANPSNYTGRTVVVGSTAYIFIGGAWQNLSNYVGGSGGGSGSGISSGTSLPAGAANVGDLFRKISANVDAGLYIYDGTWVTLPAFTANSTIARIPTLSSLPAVVTDYSAGSLIIVNGATYILNATKTSWDLFTPYGANANATISIAINAGAIGTVQLAANAVTSAKLAPNTVGGYHLISNTVGTREIAVGAIDSNKIATNAITTSKIQNNSITGDKIAANTISGSKLLLGSIGRAQLAPNIFTSISITANNLSEITSDIGTIRSGKLNTLDNKFIIDLDNRYIKIEF